MDPLSRIDAKLVALHDQMQAMQASANAQAQSFVEMRDIMKELGISIGTVAKTQQDLVESQQDLVRSQQDLVRSQQDLVRSQQDLAKSQQDLARLQQDHEERLRRLEAKK